MECPFLDNDAELNPSTSLLDKTTSSAVPCSTAEDTSCLRLGIFKCRKLDRYEVKLASVVAATFPDKNSTLTKALLLDLEFENGNFSSGNESNATTTSTTPVSSGNSK